jgi:cell division protein FtsA
MKNQLLAGLDIGSTEIRLVIGQLVPMEQGEKLQIVGAVSVPAEGISKGAINSIEDATSAISACLEKAERLLGVSVNSVFLGANGLNLKCDRSRGVVGVSRSDNEISVDDVNRAIEAAQALSVPPNYEILHVVPMEYKVDNQQAVKNPLGMSGVRLEVETLVIQSLSNQIKNMARAIERANLSIDDLVFSGLATASAVLDNKQKELGVAMVNIGATTTTLVVYEEGELLHVAVLPVGSGLITADIAIGLRCPITLAERIKLKYGSAKSEQFNKKDEIDITDLLREEDLHDEISVISRKYVSEIIEARVEEILLRLDTEFKKINRSGMLPAGVVLIGGGAKLADLVETAKKVLRLPVSLGANKATATVVDKVNEQDYLTALGLVVWGEQSRRGQNNTGMSFGNVGGTLARSAKKLWSIFRP